MTRLIGAAILAAVAVSAGCANPHSGNLLVADVPDQSAAQDPQSQPPPLPIWSVSPGDEIDDGALVIDNALVPLDITTLVADGQSWVNRLGVQWQGSALLAYGDGAQSFVTATRPGGDPDTIAESARARTQVLRRGAYVQTAEGCVLATSATSVDDVGTGSCAISLDERWVASWPETPGPLTIRDLRDDSTRTVDLAVANAAVLTKDARVFAVTSTDDGFQGVVLDATDGSEVGRTQTFRYIDVGLVGPDAAGFVAQASDGQSTQLLFVDTDAHVEVIDEGFYMAPVVNNHEVTYLKYGDDLTTSSIKRWSHGHVETLLRGYVGAGAVDADHVIATRETDDSIELYRQDGGTGELILEYTLPMAPEDASPLSGNGAGIKVLRMWVKSNTAFLQVAGDSSSSFVRIDLSGGHSDAPLVHTPGLALESLDSDGTALLSADDGAAPVDPTTGQPTGVAPRRIMAIRLHDETPSTRLVVAQAGTNLIHDGRIYVTDASDMAKVTIRSVRASGKNSTPEDLYVGKQIAGATWPEQGGALQSLLITPRLLIEQQQQQLQQQQAQQQQQEQALEELPPEESQAVQGAEP